MTYRARDCGFSILALLLAAALSGCHKEEQAVEGVAKTAAKAEHQAQASATLLDQERTELNQIPLPTKSLYVDVHDPSQWANPFLAVDANSVDLRIVLPDTNPSSFGKGTMLRPEAARRQEMRIRLSDVASAVVAIPDGAWPYGRVIAVAESPEASRKDWPTVRRNVETIIRKLNNLGIVVEEWPSR